MSDPARAAVVDGMRVVDDEALLAYHALIEALNSQDLATRLIHEMGGRRIPTARQVNLARRRRAFASGQMEMTFTSPCSGREAARLAGVPYSTWRRWRKPPASVVSRKREPQKASGTRTATRKRCTACGKVKRRSWFYRDAHSSDGRTSRCRACKYTPRPRKKSAPKSQVALTGAAENLRLLA
ncbi:MAG TPA: hypothetical protein VNN21_01270 [Dehalococcoidia bacterium]|nr:hypothetical protein [Dehalococcoidia bacterium]